jgi:hypothetical protein
MLKVNILTFISYAQSQYNQASSAMVKVNITFISYAQSQYIGKPNKSLGARRV